MKPYRYSGAGNTFVVIDGRGEDVPHCRKPEAIADICREYATDGLMILSKSESCDFRMEFFNPDGSTGMMCGNGGRCIVAFAADLGIKSAGKGYLFEAPDGIHSASILENDGRVKIICLKMSDPSDAVQVLDGWFVDTGARHFVKFVDDVDAVDVLSEGRDLRWNDAFAPEGANVDFVQRMPDGSIRVRTFEKGVEGETLACGTGAVASAVAFNMPENIFRTTVHARTADLLVESGPDGVFLTGPAEQGFCIFAES